MLKAHFSSPPARALVKAFLCVMAHLKGVAAEYYESSKLAKYPFEPYWPEKKLRICVTGAGGFIASHLAKRLKAEGHYILGCDWKRNEHMPVCCSSAWFTKGGKQI